MNRKAKQKRPVRVCAICGKEFEQQTKFDSKTCSPACAAKLRAKVWELVDPEGQHIVVDNLRSWAEEHTGDFGLPDDDASVKKIVGKFHTIASWFNGKSRSKYYKGWTLAGPAKKRETVFPGGANPPQPPSRPAP